MEKNPFSVLNLPPDADLEAAKSRYRVLARRHHPDSAPDEQRDAATGVMSELNWAMEEIERNAAEWRVQAGSEPQEHRAPSHPVSVTPTLVLLSKENRFTGYVTAAAPDVDGSAVRLRYASGLIAVERLPSFGGVANFRVTLAESIRELAAAVRERVELRAPGFKPVEVSVAVEPFATEDAPVLTEIQGGAPRLGVELLAGTAALLAGAAALLLYAA